MLAAKVQDFKYRYLFCKNEKKQLLNRFLFVNYLNNLLLTRQSKLFFTFIWLKKNKKFKTKTKIVRRCLLSNRNRGTLRPFNISRIFLRHFMHFGLLPGFKKAVW